MYSVHLTADIMRFLPCTEGVEYHERCNSSVLVSSGEAEKERTTCC